MLAGPNGSGKSTLFRSLRAAQVFPFGYCLNPDEIERELTEFGRLYLGGWGLQLTDDAIERFVRSHGLAGRITGKLPRVDGNSLIAPKGYQPGYFVSAFADLLRREWMAKEESFTFETVMSHPDRLDLLVDAVGRGYRTYLYYVCTDSARINARRIVNRVLRGGHDVAPEKVRERYKRSLGLLPRAIKMSTRAYLFDNSGGGHRLIAEYEDGKQVTAADDLPSWFVNAISISTERRKKRLS
jgi:predicted ABC-type ATPase